MKTIIILLQCPFRWNYFMYFAYINLFFNTCTFGWLLKHLLLQIHILKEIIFQSHSILFIFPKCQIVRYDMRIFKSYLLKMQYLKLIMKFSTFQRGTLFFILLTIKFKNHFIFQHQFFWKMTPSAYLPLPFPLFKVQMMTFAKFLHFSADILFSYSKAANGINFYGW